MTDSVEACIIHRSPMVTCDGVTLSYIMQMTVILSCNKEMKQEEKHVFLCSLISATVSGLGDGADTGLPWGGGVDISPGTVTLVGCSLMP